jgi:RimJ/RimL family protein N-acetyltransferase
MLLEGWEAFVVSGEVLTERLRLVPIGLEHVADLVAIHQDPWIAQWYAGQWPAGRAQEFALACARGWSADGVAKWIAYEGRTGELVGRGGLSRMGASAVRAQVATEIGRAGLGFAVGELGARSVVSFTERHNRASRNVMERLGMRWAGEIMSRGLIEGGGGEHDNAPFALYAVGRGGEAGGGPGGLGGFGAHVGG